VSPSTVLEYEHRAQAAGVSWPLPEGMDDMALEQRVFAGSPAPTDRRALPDLAYLLEEMRRPHVTLMLLWMEYKAAHPEGYQYTQFWRYYQEGKKHLEVALRQEHRAGEKLFSDYSGDTLRLSRWTCASVPAPWRCCTLAASTLVTLGRYSPTLHAPTTGRGRRPWRGNCHRRTRTLESAL
jgi:transposase